MSTAFHQRNVVLKKRSQNLEGESADSGLKTRERGLKPTLICFETNQISNSWQSHLMDW